MAVTLTACVKSILCSLSVSVLRGLDEVISVYVTIAQTQLAALNAQVALLNIQLTPINLARAAAEQSLDVLESATALLPLELIEGCADLGTMNVLVGGLFADVRADINDKLDDANRTLSLKEELDTVIAELNASLEYYEALRLIINECAGLVALG